MKKLFTLFINAFLFTITVCSQTSVWEVSKNGNVLYLGGSIHMLRAEDYPFPKEYDIAFDKADIVVFEADMGAMQNPDITSKMMMKSFLPGDKTLQTVLDEETFERLKALYAEYGLNINMLIKLKPGMLVTMLTRMQMQELDFGAEGLDSYYFNKSIKEKKKLNFLETVNFQIDLLVNMGEGYENEFVKYSLEDFDKTEDILPVMLSSWRNGTFDGMMPEMELMKKQFPDVYKAMFTDRNNNWMPIIEKYMKDKKIEFVIVGLAHMYGSDGLLQQLTDKGYTVTQVTL